MATVQENTKRVNAIGRKMVEELSSCSVEGLVVNTGRINIIGMPIEALVLSVGYWITHPDEYDLDWLAKFMTDEYSD